MAIAAPEAPLSEERNTTAPTTTTGELALPITSGDMLGRLSEASAHASVPDHHHHASHRRETFQPLKRDIVLMWSATGALTGTALAIAAAIIAG